MNRLAAIPLPMVLLAPAALKAELKSATPAVPASSAGAPDTYKNVDDPFLFAQLIQEIAAASTLPVAMVKAAVPIMPVRLAPPAPSVPAITAMPEDQLPVPARTSRAGIIEDKATKKAARPTVQLPAPAVEIPVPAPPAPVRLKPAEVSRNAVGGNAPTPNAVSEAAPEQAPRTLERMIDVAFQLRIRPQQEPAPAPTVSAAPPAPATSVSPWSQPTAARAIVTAAPSAPPTDPPAAPPRMEPPIPFELPVAHEPVAHEEAGRAAITAPVRASTTAPAAARPVLSDAPAVTYYARQFATAAAPPVISSAAPLERTEPRPTPPPATATRHETPASAVVGTAAPAPSGPVASRDSPVEPPPVPNVPGLRPAEPARPHAEAAYVPDLAAPIAVAAVPASNANAEIIPQPAAASVPATAAPVPPGSPAPLQELTLPAQPAAAPPLRSFSLEFAPDGAGDVRLKLSERAGEVHVSLHSSDPSLAERLHEGVHDLVGSLSRAGYDAEAWTPGQGRQSNQRQADTPRKTRREGSSGSGAEDFDGMLQQPIQEVS